MYLVSVWLYTLGNVFSVLYLKYDKFFLYKLHSWCMMESFEINKKYNINFWK